MKTFKGLFIDNGIIKAGEFPVEPTRCDEHPDYPYDYPCHLCQAEATAYSVALASAKANAVECEDQEKALGLAIITCPSDAILLRGGLVVGVQDGIYPLPSGWDYRVEEQLVISSRVKEGAPLALERKYRKGAILYRTDEQPEPEESQEVLWSEAEDIIAEAMGTYKTSLTVALASYARKELEKHFTITRRK